jgi:hypothetical protein
MDVFKTLLLDTPDALNAITGTLQIANGGTGATDAAGARDNLLPDYTGNVGKVLTVNAGATDVEWTTNGAGTVTSVDVSGGTTGLTTSGGPVTSSGTITLAGTLAVANGGTGITSLGSGVATFLGTPSSANLAAAVTDETGTGALVFASSPTLVTPTLGAATATSINGVTVTGTSTPALSVTGTTAVSGTNTGDQTTITGNAGTATTLETARNINGVSFNGSADITVTAAAGTLTGATLASGVTASSLTSLGTIASLVATTADINGGTIDATTIGATTPSTGAFTTLSSTGATSLATGTTGLGIFNSAPNSYLPGIAGVAIGPVENASLSLADTASTKYWNTYNNNSTLKWYLSAAAYSTTGATGDVMALSSTGLAVTGALSSTTGANFATSSGNVGIGTASPGAKLDVNGTLRSWGNCFLSTGNTNTDPVASRVNGLCVQGAAIYMRNGLTMKWGLSGSGDHVLFFSDNGSVAVQGGGINTTGSTTAFNTTSDARLKTNFRQIANSGSIIDAICPVLHDWKTGETDSYGFLAQELIEVFPRAVTAGDNDSEVSKPWGVDMSKLIPVLVAEIKSMRARIAALEPN